MDDTGGAIGSPGGSAIKSVTFNTIDISGQTNIAFKGLFAAGNTNLPRANRYDEPDRMRIHYSVDGSSMGVESQLGVGTTFIIEFPRALEELAGISGA